MPAQFSFHMTFASACTRSTLQGQAIEEGAKCRRLVRGPACRPLRIVRGCDGGAGDGTGLGNCWRGGSLSSHDFCLSVYTIDVAGSSHRGGGSSVVDCVVARPVGPCVLGPWTRRGSVPWRCVGRPRPRYWWKSLLVY